MLQQRWLVALVIVGTVLLFGAVLHANRIQFPLAAFLREAALVVVAYFAYFLVRGATEGKPSVAIAHAGRVIDLEKLLWLDHEAQLQEPILDHQWMVTLANWTYIWGHWPLIAVVAVWLFIARRPTYYTFRNAFLISGAIGLLVFALYPVAPPRIADPGVTDTVTLYSESYRVLQPPALVNQYAAMPSLHFGWNLLIGIALFRTAPRNDVRVFALVLPLVMWLSVVVTGNHYIIDTIAGGALALFGLALAALVAGWSARRRRPHAPVAPPRVPARAGEVRPIAIAHRFGDSLEQLRAAIAAGAAYVEADVWCSRGQLEVRHEKTLGPLPLEWDRWYMRRRPAKPLLLAEILAALPKGVGVMLDLKGSDRRLPGMLLDVLRRHGDANPIMVSARFWDHLASLRDHPKLLLFHSVGTRGQLRRVRPLLDGREHDAICAHYRLLDAATVRALKEHATVVATWPINDAERLHHAVEWGVDAVITDNVEVMRSLGANQGSRSTIR